RRGRRTLDPATRPPHAGWRIRGRGDPQPRSRGPPRQCRRQACRRHRLGPRSAGKPGADARLPRPRTDRRPLCAVARRRTRLGRARAAASHGALLRGPRRRHDGPRCDRRIEGEDQLTMVAPASVQQGPIRDALTEAKGLAAGLPDLLIEARRVAATIIAGWHGRRAAGRGETFWQFRPFTSGDATTGIDWRRSARDDHFYVREKEWEAAHTVWLWLDLSPSMVFRSRLASVSKRDRGMVFLLALADLLAAAGERVGLLGESDLILARNAAERIGRFLALAKPGQPDT